MNKTVFLRLIAAACGVVFLGLAPHAWAAQSERVTNMALLEKAISSAVESLVKGMPVSNLNGPVLMTPSGAHEADWMVQNILGARLREEGITIVVGGPKPAKPAAAEDTSRVADTTAALAPPETPEPVPIQLVLSHRITELRMEYPRAWRPHLVGRKMVERHAYAALSVRVVDENSGALLWVGESKASERDAVPVSEIVFLEGDGESWEKGQMPAGRLGGLIEPLVVAAIVGGLVYLFYSNKE
ncbi:MAG: hypothetical protein JW952_01475 [Candidatus Eisenbacteria bacterium]|nr:hypothetical protein [Candidatus Eisenbacteria bacterium]